MPVITRPTLTYNAERGVRDGSSEVISYSNGGSSVARQEWVNWADRYKAGKFFLGYSALEYVSGTSGPIAALRRLTPMPHPNAGNAVDDVGQFYAMKMPRIKPYKATGQVTGADGLSRATFTKAEIEITYENPGYAVLTEADITVSGVWQNQEYRRFLRIMEPTQTVSYITLPGGTLKYITSTGTGAANGKAIGANVGKVFPVNQEKYLWCRLPYDLYNPSALSVWAKRIWGDPASPSTIPLIGCVNKTSFFGRAPGTLLLQNVRPIPRDAMFGGVYEWDFEVQLAYNLNGWNKLYYYPAGTVGASDRGFFLVGAGTTYYAPGSVPDNYSIYNEREFSAIFDVRDTIP